MEKKCLGCDEPSEEFLCKRCAKNLEALGRALEKREILFTRLEVNK